MHGEGPSPTLTAVRRSRPGQWRSRSTDVPGASSRTTWSSAAGSGRGSSSGGRFSATFAASSGARRRSQPPSARCRAVTSPPSASGGVWTHAASPPRRPRPRSRPSAAGVVDDDRLARSRARALAQRGWGDAAVAARLAQEGLPSQAVTGALAELPAERERRRARSADTRPPRPLAPARAARVRAGNHRGRRGTWTSPADSGYHTDTFSRIACTRNGSLAESDDDENDNHKQLNGTQHPGGRKPRAES